MFTCSTTNSTLSAKTLLLIERAKKLSSEPACTYTSPTILTRSPVVSETILTFNSRFSPLTYNLDRALHRIAELEGGAKRSAELLAFALDRISKLEEQSTRCPTIPNSLLTPSTPNSLLTPTWCTPKRRPSCAKGANCNFGHSAMDSTTTSDSEDSLAGRRLAPLPPRRSKRRPSPYRPQVKSSSVPYPPSPPASCAPPLFLPRLAHDLSPADLAEEQEIASTLCPLRSRTDLVDELLADVIGTVTKEAERRRAHLALAHSTDLLAQKYAKSNVPRVDAGWHPPLKAVLHSADVSAPTVDWAKVYNPRNMPKTQGYPLHGCDPDADFYNKCIGAEDCQEQHDGKEHKVEKWITGCHFPATKERTYHQSTSRWEKESSYLTCPGWMKGEKPAPYGWGAGILTNLGVVPMPTGPLFGLINHAGRGKKIKI